jgi:hypothetical protein
MKSEECEEGSPHFWVNATFLDSAANTPKTFPDLRFSHNTDEHISLLGYDDVSIGKCHLCFRPT